MSVYGPCPKYSEDDFPALAEKLSDSMRGLGTDEEQIIEVLVDLTNEQRQAVKELYHQKYGTDLIDDLKGELGGHFEDSIVALMTTPVQLQAKIINDAVKGAGTDESAIIGVMVTKNNDEMAELKELYKAEYEEELEEALEGDSCGYFSRMLRSLVTGAREETWDDEERAQADVELLRSAGVDKLGTDELQFNDVLCSRSIDHLQLVFKRYREQDPDDRDIEDAVDSEMSGHLREGYLSIIKMVKDPCAYFAWRINEAVKNIGTNEQELIRVIISRSEIDLQYIKQRYEQMYETTAYEAIKNDIGGDFRQCLLSVLEGRFIPKDDL